MIFIFLYEGTMIRDYLNLFFLMILGEPIWHNDISLLTIKFHLVAYVINGRDIFEKC